MATYNSAVEGTWTMKMGILVRASSPPDDFGFTAAASICDMAATLMINAPCASCGSLSGDFLGQGSPADPIGRLFPSNVAPAQVQTCLPYIISEYGSNTGNPQVINDGDGTVTVRYRFRIPAMGKSADTTIRLSVAALRICGTPPPPTAFDRLSVSTVPSMFRTIPGTPVESWIADQDQGIPDPSPDPALPQFFFKHATPDWRGCGVRA